MPIRQIDSFYNFGFDARMNAQFHTIDGRNKQLSDYRGKVCLIVNVASECGLTPQYEALEKIYEKYREQGFEVLAFPCNDFGAQEPGTHQQIQEFCSTKFGVKFQLFEKISVKGKDQHPLYKELIAAQPTAIQNPGVDFEAKLKEYGITREKKTDILWNFEKFLVSRDGKTIARFAPDYPPDAIGLTSSIEKALG